MKKVIFGSMFALVFLFAGAVAHADTKCGDPALSGGGTTYVACGNGMPIPNPGPVMKQGQSVTDEGGITSLCDLVGGCVDLTHLVSYHNTMISNARDLVARGWASQFPFMAGWINLASK